MDRRHKSFGVSVAIASIALTICSCKAPTKSVKLESRQDEYVSSLVKQVQYETDIEEQSSEQVVAGSSTPISVPPPFTLDDFQRMEYRDLSLQEALQLALVNAKVLRNAGGTVIQSSQPAPTILDPAIQTVDPRNGVEAALSKYDAIYTSDVSVQNLDQALNNSFFGGGTRTLKQDIFGFHHGLVKRTVSGAQFGLYHDMDYDANNAPGNLFDSAWTTFVVAEARQPLGRGRGTEVNRIAGPYTQAGVYNGVKLAKLNSNVELRKFERAIRDLASNVENAYWDLYLSYRVFDAKNKAYAASQDIYKKVAAQANAGRSSTAESLQARWQRDFFLSEVETSITGSRREGTRTNNGSGGGSLLTNSGLFQAERRLRLLLGLPSSDGLFLRPVEEPMTAPVRYLWDDARAEALARRVELREERLNLKKHELQLTAAKQHMLPVLDLVARHRSRGFGRRLIDDDPAEFSNAYQNLIDGDFQEWEFGLDFSVALGKRAEYAALRKAKLELARAKFIYQAKEKDVENELHGAYQELDATLRRIHRTEGIHRTAESEVETLQALYETGQATLDQLLDAHRRLSDSELMYRRAVVEYSLALKDFHFQKGTLLDYEAIQFGGI